MPGGLIQLSAQGPENIFLTGQPQITFFKSLYRRHTNFSMEAFNINVQNLKFGHKKRIQIPPIGDLITKMYFQLQLPEVIPEQHSRFAWVRRVGHAIINSVSLEIGGCTIDKHLGIWLDIWYELSHNHKNDSGYLKMIGDIDELTKFDCLIKPVYNLSIPLIFWFNRHIGLSLPIGVFKYQDVYLVIEINDFENLIVTDHKMKYPSQNLISNLIIDYIFLDIEERDKFFKYQHEYLIEQVQTIDDHCIETEIDAVNLAFKHPIKELIWCVKNGNYISGKKFIYYDNNWKNYHIKLSKELLNSCSILLEDMKEATLVDNAVNILKLKLDIRVTDPNKCCILPTINVSSDILENILNNKNWEMFKPGCEQYTDNGRLKITNMSDKTFWINTKSLLYNDCSIIDKISACINISSTCHIYYSEIHSDINIEDLSIPLDDYNDLRIKKEAVYIKQFANYGLFVDGKTNPIKYTKVQFNDQDRIVKRSGNFFGSLQPYLYHSNTPAEGINLYSFAFQPEQLQPTGTSNFTTIDSKIMTVTIDKRMLNASTRFYAFAPSYNILRIGNGFAGLAYS